MPSAVGRVLSYQNCVVGAIERRGVALVAELLLGLIAFLKLLFFPYWPSAEDWVRSSGSSLVGQMRLAADKARAIMGATDSLVVKALMHWFRPCEASAFRLVHQCLISEATEFADMAWATVVAG